MRTPLIRALRETASRLEQSASYQWGHMGMCNCGYLAQSITGLTPAEIHSSAMERYGDWEEQANRYCPTSGLLIDSILASMMELGMTATDIRNLERLADPVVRRRIHRRLRHNVRDDVVLYMRAWADELSEGEVRDPEAKTLHDLVGAADDRLPAERVGEPSA
jgi:hypothetical protein